MFLENTFVGNFHDALVLYARALNQTITHAGTIIILIMIGIIIMVGIIIVIGIITMIESIPCLES